MTWFLVALSGAFGALARFELGSWVADRTESDLPVGTLAVNAVGALLAGLAWAADMPETVAIVVSTGFLGGFTTFSTWMVESGRLLEDDERPTRGIANVVLMLISGLAGAFIGGAMR